MAVFCRCGVCGTTAEMNSAIGFDGNREPPYWIALDVTHWPDDDRRPTLRVRVCPECLAHALGIANILPA